MQHYRVTKYDPSRRDISGAYPADDWTSRSDIGQSFGGVTLTEERYVAVEDAYLESAAAFLKEAGVRELVVVGLEKVEAQAKVPSEGEVISAEGIPAVLRALLREEYWCRLDGASAFVHVGWDYYMYIGVPMACRDSERVARDLGLFVEEFRSPYADVAA